jgi:hypothetical protein
MSGFAASNYRELGLLEDFKARCYRQVEGATFNRTWDLITVTVTRRRVRIYAHLNWVAREEGGGVRYVTEYEIGEGAVRVLSHQEVKDK